MSDIKDKLLTKLYDLYEQTITNFFNNSVSGVHNSFPGSYIYDSNLGQLIVVDNYGPGVLNLYLSIYNVIVGQTLLIKNKGHGHLQLNDMTGKLFDNNAVYIMNPNSNVQLIYSGTSWIIIN